VALEDGYNEENLAKYFSQIKLRKTNRRSASHLQKQLFLFKQTQLACLHEQNKSGFLEGRLLSSQSEQLKKYLKSSYWLEKSRPSKKATFVLIM